MGTAFVYAGAFLKAVSKNHRHKKSIAASFRLSLDLLSGGAEALVKVPPPFSVLG